MDERLAAAQAALTAGRGGDAIQPLIELITDEPNQTVQVYRALLVQLYHAGRLEEGAIWGAAGAKRYPRDIDLLNVLGVVYRRLFRYPEAIAALSSSPAAMTIRNQAPGLPPPPSRTVSPNRPPSAAMPALVKGCRGHGKRQKVCGSARSC